MAEATYETLTPERCKEMLLALLELDETAEDADIEAAFEAEMGEDVEAAEAEPVVEEETVTETAPAPAPKSKYRGSAMTVLVRPRK